MRVPREERGSWVDQTLVTVDVGIELVIAIRNAHCTHEHIELPIFSEANFLFLYFYVNNKRIPRGM
jgi:hypothetical protein